MMIISGLLITGGKASLYERLSSTELWSPGLACTLPPMTRPRSTHSLSGGLACGGYGNGTKDSCEIWTSGGWEQLDSRLSVERARHSVWLPPTTNTTFLIGGDRSWRSVDTVTTTGRVAQPDLTLKHGVM